jgi:energy-coupling factor transporter ATP-binding protein EcfA2
MGRRVHHPHPRWDAQHRRALSRQAARLVRGIRLEDRVLLVGSTGDGKSTIAESLAVGLQPVRTVLCDPKAEHEVGVAPVSDAAGIAEQIRGPVCHWIPASFDRDALEEGFQVIWNTPGPLLLWIDELAEVSSPQWCPEGLRLQETQGRKLRKGVLACTQRVAECHPVFRSQSEHIFLMVPRPIELDLKTIAGNIRREASVLGAELDSLEQEHGPYSHLWYVKPGNELRRCAPLPELVRFRAPDSTRQHAAAGEDTQRQETSPADS